ncbi:sialate O-acetylesterase [Rubritalea marina]|uniref:sialate O-acetylesterase n=1 Tax=Rubritalea marina TaxID=361055 RepID=UPI00037EAF67|nr:sialate O-acetylesterase [Rubritalea marina]
MKHNYIVSALLGLTAISHAEVTLPQVINSKMVLQRGVPAPIWGWADQGEKVTVQFAGQTKTTLPDANGKWMVKLDPLTASSESRVMTISGKNEHKLEDVLVGEVWLASGQSNMEWTFSQIVEAERTLAVSHKDNNLVRAFHVNQHVQSGVPLDDTVGMWKNCNDMVGASLHSVSAVGFFFAVELQKQLDVPVAILDSNWGGQRIDLFISKEGYESVGLPYRAHADNGDKKVVARRLNAMAHELQQAAKSADKGITRPVALNNVYGWANNGIYNAMIAPLAPYALKGAIWYQGESNRSDGQYFEKVKALSNGWSKAFNVKDIPLYQVQIAPYDYTRGANPKDSTLCNTIWSAQYRAAKEIPGVGVVAIHDTNINIQDIHPAHKLPVAQRLAAQALKNEYGKDVVTTGPSVASAQRTGDKVVVSFTDIGQGLTTNDGEAPSWFEISADGTNFVTADAALKGNTVELKSSQVKNPQFVRMGWVETAIPNLTDKNGWPVFSFAPIKVQ